MIFALLAATNAQYLRLSSNGGSDQLINLGTGGGAAPRAGGRNGAARAGGAGGAGGAGAGGAAAKSGEDESPKPFSFNFESEDEYGTKMARSENADGSGTVTGSYSFSDATGISRTVTYTADDSGFHAVVDTNEPGTLTSNPADVEIKSTAQ